MRAAIILVVLLTTPGVPTTTHGATIGEKADLIEVTREIILNTAQVGLDEAGTRILGPTAWRFLKQAANPVFERLKQQYPNLFRGDGKGTPEIQKEARDAANMLEENHELQSMLINGFSNLKQGQQEIITEIRLLKVKLEKTNTSIAEMSKLNRESFNIILSELKLIREQPKSNANIDVAAPLIKVLLEDDFKTRQDLAVYPNAQILKSYYGSGGLLLENVTQGTQGLYDLTKAGFIKPPARIEVSFRQLGGPRSFYGIMFGGTSSNKYENAYTLSINGDGYYMVDKYFDDKHEKTIDFGFDAAIRQGLNADNNLRVDIIGRQIKYFVNGKHLGTYTANEDARGFIGIYLTPPQKKVLLDNFRLSEIGQ
jgi:hypothetical protein